MSIKDNFSQAVKELWKKDGQDNKKPEAQQGQQMTELDRYLREPEKQGVTNNIPTMGSGDEVPLETPYYRAPSAEKPAEDPQPARTEPAQTAQAAPAAQTAENVMAQGSNVVVPPSAPQQQGFAPRQDAPQNRQGGEYNANVRNIRSTQGQTNQNEYNQGGGYVPSSQGSYNQGGYGGGYVPPAQGGGAPMQAQNETEELTVISKNTIIDGNIHSLANMQIDGNIKGNVETTRNLDMSGKIIGDITCNNAGMNSAAMQGNMSLKGRLRMDRDTILIGDLSSQYADINGRVRGKLDIVGKAELKRDAIVFGDINASTIAVTDGAIIQGYVNTTFLSKEDSRNVFPDAISLDSKEAK